MIEQYGHFAEWYGSTWIKLVNQKEIYVWLDDE